MRVTIRYPTAGFTEHLEAAQVEPGVCRLHSFSEHVPLCPGDLVLTDGDVVTRVMRLDEVFLVKAYFKLNTPSATVEARALEWHMATPVHQTSPFTILVASPSLRWVRDVVEADPLLMFMKSLRIPGEVFSLDQAKEKV